MASEHKSSEKKLAGKVAIITGGASGLGEATARLFAEHGAKVVIADIQEEKGREVAESIGGGGSSSSHHHFVKCDVSDEQQVESLVKATVEAHGQVHVVVCCAGVISGQDQDILNLDLDASDSLFAVNVRGTAAMVKHAARAMVDGGVKGCVICTASVTATFGTALKIDYAMSKHAVLGLVRSASIGLGKHGIRVNCVSPSAVATPLLCTSMNMPEEEIDKVFEPFNVLKNGEFLKPKNVADAVLFLACDDSKFVTGHNLVVDAGFHPNH
ncbi:PREDICTED: (-)-isopiperitenol/(-)-carveol dehydrogenase, mitochondrial-like [Ipomoea nil]|uniref:(-)-isopiperitenol/(-)-carveol dehydrogenase, mitochondrial-like n=1 Tax=Ipomoea nil TaxID=35883 RepID=UPI0009019C09|nr:PREDICTED: (-)-isopiperitenol/(-)-carveol dehydrogenase, mitochondrial-like [Ipomoea nil]